MSKRVQFRRSVDTAEQGAKFWELRAAVNLALRREQGRHGEARDLLAPVYGWLTEGFDTPDLRDAKALLDCIETAPAGSASNASRGEGGASARSTLPDPHL
jgi:predicted ATPase